MNSIIHCLLNIFGFKLIVILYMCVFISTQVHIILGGGGVWTDADPEFYLRGAPCIFEGFRTVQVPSGSRAEPDGGIPRKLLGIRDLRSYDPNVYMKNVKKRDIKTVFTGSGRSLLINILSLSLSLLWRGGGDLPEFVPVNHISKTNLYIM